MNVVIRVFVAAVSAWLLSNIPVVYAETSYDWAYYASVAHDVHVAYGDPCKRAQHNYLLSEIGKRCVPRLTSSQRDDILRRAARVEPSRRVYLRFAFAQVPRLLPAHWIDVAHQAPPRVTMVPQLVLVDANGMTTPSGQDSRGSFNWQIVGTANQWYNPRDGTTSITPP